jgi:16S rRNA (uracil1498-N3)-methyltransferase
MTYFLYSGEIEIDVEFTLQGTEARHILLARRIKEGEEIVVQDGTPRRYLTKVIQRKRNSILLLPISRLTPPPEPDFRIHLYQSIVKEKAIDHIIQKATELGVASLNLFQSDFSPNGDYSSEKKLERWNRIAWSACKQSGRIKPPAVRLIPKETELEIEEGETIFLSLTDQSLPLSRLELTGEMINVIIGPEGGWSEREITTNRYPTFHLGPRTLRADTASLAVISILQYRFGDFLLQPV